MRQRNQEFDKTTEEIEYYEKVDNRAPKYIKRNEFMEHANDHSNLNTMRTALEKAGFNISKEDV